MTTIVDASGHRSERANPPTVIVLTRSGAANLLESFARAYVRPITNRSMVLLNISYRVEPVLRS